ncbi:hypothetical protein AB72_1968 [Escherichia coli 1-250-04_S1_C3]|nr:hypothetical protein AB72_1968 [Escherichia coli 1-250-04_S1_C3]KDX34258.1 hypothetical protein AB41_0445 [Escherichia coli 1-250-04_S1_C2]KDX35468.1 hypothetical protein AB13_0233 [Escherichia coli 1-250-04_S1_C1]
MHVTQIKQLRIRKAIKHETETIKGEMTQVIYCKERIKKPRQ